MYNKNVGFWWQLGCCLGEKMRMRNVEGEEECGGVVLPIFQAQACYAEMCTLLCPTQLPNKPTGSCLGPNTCLCSYPCSQDNLMLIINKFNSYLLGVICKMFHFYSLLEQGSLIEQFTYHIENVTFSINLQSNNLIGKPMKQFKFLMTNTSY